MAVQDQFGAATPQEQEQLSSLKMRMSRQLLPFRDPNGFRKLVVLLTQPGAALRPSCEPYAPKLCFKPHPLG